MRIAVYDQYWSTLGGGEQFAGGIAAALADHHDVTLVGPEPIDTGRFAPTGTTWRYSSAVSSLGWRCKGRLPTSSRNKVPPSAA